MKPERTFTLGLAGLAALGLAGAANAQQAELIEDTRFVRTLNTTTDLDLEHQTEHAEFGDPFDATVSHAGAFGGSTASQDSTISFDFPQAFELSADLSVASSSNGTFAAGLEQHYADTFLDVIISTEMPIRYDAVVELTSEGDSHVYFRGLDLERTDDGVYEGQGTLEAGEHQFRSWAYASTLVDQVLGEQGLTVDSSATADITITGHVVPSPAAVGPGLALMGLLLMRRWGNQSRCSEIED